MALQALRWQNHHLEIIDQTLLPGQLTYIPLTTRTEVWEAIKALRVRGAPAIGLCAAYGVLVALHERAPRSIDEALEAIRDGAAYLATSRPTAVNLFWALERMCTVAETAATELSLEDLIPRLEIEANLIYQEEVAACRMIGEYGAPLVPEGGGVLTHCNAGGLATGEYGTALAPLYRAHELGRKFRVYADETRPLLQGARLTAWELMQAGVDVTLICDNMAAQVMREDRVHVVMVGADRIAANGDTANKIGTYGVAVLAKAHGIPFYVAAPVSTFDLSLPHGGVIPIEQRDAIEVTNGFGKPTAPAGVKVYNPAFDVTPAELIAGIITEQGLLTPPFSKSIRQINPCVCSRTLSAQIQKPA
jgi:methylthioribose-1-phosphate isomerase